jgi:hypothetical protein
LTKSCIIIRPVADGAFHCGESFWVVLKTYHAAPRNSSFVQQRRWKLVVKRDYPSCLICNLHF